MQILALIPWSIASLVIGSVIGGLIGLILGWMTHHRKRAVIPAIVGSSLGTLLLGAFPLLWTATPEKTSPYSGIFVLQVFFIWLPIGAVLGAILGSILGLTLSAKLNRQITIAALGLSYSAIVIALLMR